MFTLVEECRHSCSSALPTFKRVWIRRKALELSKQQKVTPQKLKKYIKDEYRVDVDEIMVRNALACSKNVIEKERTMFGFVAPFLSEL